MTDVEVLGLTDDREHVLVRVGDDTVEVSLIDIHRAERQRPTFRPEPGDVLTPRVIQHRIRSGESSEQIAREAGLPYASVARYEGPALAEREHHARLARQAEVDGQVVETLVTSYLGTLEPVDWDAWLLSFGRWEVRASSAGRVVRLRWEPHSRRVTAADEASRRALKQAAAGDALTAVLRPVSMSEPGVRETPPTQLPETSESERDAPVSQAAPSALEPAAEAPEPPAAAGRPQRRSRAEVPLWDDISLSVSGRAAESSND
jgi:hypothetical protein